MLTREPTTGAIIPKIEPRLSTPDIYEEKAGLGMSKPRANPITFHVYPGGRETSVCVSLVLRFICFSYPDDTPTQTYIYIRV